MTQTATIRVRIDPEVKHDLSAWYRSRGTTLSQAIRSFLFAELEKSREEAASAALRQFDEIMASADAKRAASGEPPLTDQDIVDFVETVRVERAAKLR